LDEKAKAASKQFQPLMTKSPTLMLPAVPIDSLLPDGDDPDDLDFDSFDLGEKSWKPSSEESKSSSAASSSTVTPAGRTWIPRSAKLAAYCNFLSSRRMEWTAELFNVLHPGTAEEHEPANFKEACRDPR
jgi:hypothetical protein